MASNPHPDFDGIKQIIEKLFSKGTSFSGVCYRCTEPKYAGQIASVLGSFLHGGRWNPKRSFLAVYLCESVEAALQEYLARARRRQLSNHKSLPMIMGSIKEEIGPWLLTKMEEFDDRTPADLIANGDTGRLWASLFYLRSGMPD